MFSPFFLSLFLTDKCNILHEAVYKPYEYGDVLVVNCYCVYSFLSLVFTDKCIILHKVEV